MFSQEDNKNIVRPYTHVYMYIKKSLWMFQSDGEQMYKVASKLGMH